MLACCLGYKCVDARWACCADSLGLYKQVAAALQEQADILDVHWVVDTHDEIVGRLDNREVLADSLALVWVS